MAKRRRKKNVSASSKVGIESIGAAIEEMRAKGEMPESRLDEGEPVAINVRATPVALGIPFDDLEFSKWTRQILSKNTPMPWDDRIFIGSTYLPEARNKIHDAFLEDSHCETLWMLDSDVIPPPNTVEALLTHMQNNRQVRMVGGWYRLKEHPYLPVVYHDEGDQDGRMDFRQYGLNEIGEGLEMVDGAGAGCWLMHRSVAEAIGKSPYDMQYGGEDLLLCRKVREAGFGLWIDWRIACAHAGVAVA